MVADVDSLIADDAPDWFRRALHTPFFDEHVEVDGARIHYLAWGEPGRRGLVFVHGGAAHAHWWTHVAASFARQYRVVAIDLSGHGDSAHRDATRSSSGPTRSMAVAADAGIDGAPVVVGHSMGGFVSIATGALHSDELAGVIVLDSPVAEPDPRDRRGPGRAGVRRARRCTRPSTRPWPGSAPSRPRSTTCPT